MGNKKQTNKEERKGNSHSTSKSSPTKIQGKKPLASKKKKSSKRQPYPKDPFWSDDRITWW